MCGLHEAAGFIVLAEDLRLAIQLQQLNRENRHQLRTQVDPMRLHHQRL
jgi:hypothetical protein